MDPQRPELHPVHSAFTLPLIDSAGIGAIGNASLNAEGSCTPCLGRTVRTGQSTRCSAHTGFERVGE